MGKITDEPGNPDDQRKEGIFFSRKINGLQGFRCISFFSNNFTQKNLPFPRKGKKKACGESKRAGYFLTIVSLSMATADFSTVIFRPPVPTSRTTVFSLISAIFP